MSKLWTTLKSVVGSAGSAAAGAAREAEIVTAAAVASSSSSSAPPSSTSDGILHGFATVKPHVPMMKFRLMKKKM